MNENEVYIEILDKREPKQKLIVKNSDISNPNLLIVGLNMSHFTYISLPHVKVTYADLKQLPIQRYEYERWQNK